MNGPGFWHGVGVALLLSVAGAIVHTALAPLLGTGLVLRAVIVGLGAAYLAVLLHALRARIGRSVVLAGWLALTLLLCVFDPTLWVWLLAQALIVWLVRSLYRHESVSAALADAALNAFALVTAIATAAYTHSVLLTLWSWFLVQALFVLIGRPAAATANASDDSFAQAYRTAEAALRRLSTRPH